MRVLACILTATYPAGSVSEVTHWLTSMQPNSYTSMLLIMLEVSVKATYTTLDTSVFPGTVPIHNVCHVVQASGCFEV